MNLDEIDIKTLMENFDIDTIKQLDANNVYYINKYLSDNSIYYAKDLLISSLDLFLHPGELFIEKLEKLGEDTSLIEIMYE